MIPSIGRLATIVAGGRAQRIGRGKAVNHTPSDPEGREGPFLGVLGGFGFPATAGILNRVRYLSTAILLTMATISGAEAPEHILSAIRTFTTPDILEALVWVDADQYPPDGAARESAGSIGPTLARRTAWRAYWVALTSPA